MSLRSNVVANYLGQGWAALMGVAFVPLYVAVLGIESYALVGVFAILYSALTLMDFGLSATLNREMARMGAGAPHTPESIRDLLRSVEVVCASAAIVAMAVIWAFAPWIATVWLKPEGLLPTVVIDAVRVMSVVLAMRWLEQIYRGALQGLRDYIWLNAVNALTATLRWGGVYVVVLVWPTISAFFVWQGVISFATILVFAYRMHAKLPRGERAGRFDVSSLRGVKGFASGMFLGAMLAFALMQVDKLIIGAILPLEQMGYYVLAGTIATGLSQLIGPMNAALFPHFSSLVAKNDEISLEKYYLTACQWTSFIVVPPALALAIFSDSALLAWTGDPRLTSAITALLALLVMGTLFNAFMHMPYLLQLAYGWVSLSIKINVVAVAVLVPALLYAVPKFGAISAAMAWFVLNFSYVLLNAHLMHRKLLKKSKWAWYRGAILTPLVAGFAASFFLRHLLPTAQTRAASGLQVILVVAMTYLTVAAAMPNIRVSLTTFVRTKLRRVFTRRPL